ncbi:hypothetical protein WG908_01185 [Sphingobium sp. AN641]|uniref:hypothetical protein n=1 Tax=Sphingobium sp. AN641 TaxID=3133443 RepID=UPI0030BA309D
MGKTMLRGALALAGALLLSGCLVTPGKFESHLDIRADRSFTFAYKGEIIASDMGKDVSGSDTGPSDETLDATPQAEQSAFSTAMLWREQSAPSSGGKDDEPFSGKPSADEETRLHAIAAALLKEKGFRSARYMGNKRFEIDYAISGSLTHAFLFPFNIDAQIVLPFVAIELRGDDKVRVKAPGFANSADKGQGPMIGGGGPDDAAAKALDGVFTLTTDAEIVSQNQEDGASVTPRGRQLRWIVKPMTNEAPMAVLRLQPR